MKRAFERTVLLLGIFFLLPLHSADHLSYAQRPAPGGTGQRAKTRKVVETKEEKATPSPTPAPATVQAPPSAGQVDPLLLRSFKWRSVGPANMGGRVADFAVVESNPDIIFAGLGTGGVWKTTNHGVTWSPVFDREAVASVGAVAVSPSDSNLVWVGTGEANNRNSSSWGNGVYKSTDAGKTWTNVGLENTHDIGRIAIHPADSNTVYVTALGHLWGPNKERGLYKTTDGGKTWTAVLQIDAETGPAGRAAGGAGSGAGVVDVAMDPSDPNIVYAAAYQRRRTPWSFTSGGPGSGLYKSTDGGKTWRKLTQGLPAGSLGRIGIDIYRKNPNVVYAIIESDVGGRTRSLEEKSREGGLFRSEDKGETWKRISEVNPRPFYYSKVRVDPQNENNIYVLGARLYTSEDGGKTFRSDAGRDIHGDFHAMWIDPSNSNHLIAGSDGGIYLSYDRAKTWDFVNHLPIGEFYNVSVDTRRPYFICGGLQDTGSWCGPSASRNQDGITNADWYRIGGGDGFHVASDPGDPDIVYAESQGGNLFRLNRRTGERKNLKPVPKEGEPAYRFNWNSPFVISHHDSKTLYFGGNRLFKLTERGDRWDPISPDLSTQDPQKMTAAGSGAETHCTIVSLAESPLKAGLIWAGTDDGNIQVTQDGGATWTNVAANLAPTSPGQAGPAVGGASIPKNLYVSRLEASHFEEGTAYVAIDGHRSDIFSPFLFMTTDFGKTWKSIVGNLPLAENARGEPRNAPVKVIREDPRNRQLLFAGTEFGFYVSFDRGGKWLSLKNDLPTVAVDDIVIHPRDRDVVIGTHGRSIYVLDDITPLEELTPEVLAADVHLFSIRPALRSHYLPGNAAWGHRFFKAKNPPFGAYINYYLKAFTGEEVKITIADAAGKKVRELTGTQYPGFNRVVWDLQFDPIGRVPASLSGEQPELVPAGEYTVTLAVGEKKLSTKLVVEE